MEKKRIKWKLNLFDLLVVVLVLAVAVGIVGMKYRQSQAQQAAQNQGGADNRGAVRYQIELTDLFHDTALLAEVGDELTERTRKQALGTVEALEVTQTRKKTQNMETGNYHYVPVPERYTITATVTAPALWSESSVTLDSGFEVRAGQEVRVFGPGYYASGYITCVERG